MVPPQAGRRRGRWAAREKAPATARPNPPPISPCSLRRAPPFRCERSEQAEPPAYPGGPHHSAKFCSQNFAEPPTTPYRAPAKKTVPGDFREPLMVAFYDCILDLRLFS